MTSEERKEHARLNAAKWAKENPEKNRAKCRRYKAFMACGEREPAPPRQPKPVSAAELERRKQRKAEYMRAYEAAHRADRQARQNELRAANRVRYNAAARHRRRRKIEAGDFRERERMHDYVQRFRKNNPDYIRQWKAKNIDKIRAYKREWYRKTRAMKKAEKLSAAISKLQQTQTSTQSKA